MVLKSVVILLLVAFLAQTLGVSRITDQVKEQCRQQTGLSQEEARVLKPAEVLSPKKKCYIKCLFATGGYISTNGTVMVEKMRTDHIADGNNVRLDKVYACASSLTRVNTCEKITDLIDCFSL